MLPIVYSRMAKTMVAKVLSTGQMSNYHINSDLCLEIKSFLV